MERKLAKQPAARPASSIVLDIERVVDRQKALDDVIARRAYEVFENFGRENGHSLDHWLRAESEILGAVPLEISEAEHELIVRAEVPGFSADDLAVAVEPCRLLISGRKDVTVQEEAGETDRAARRGDQFFCAVDLPAEIDSARVEAWLDVGVLRVVLPTMSTEAETRREVAAAL